MKKICILVSSLFMFTIVVNGQLKTYLTIEAGPAWDISRVQDPGNMFSQSFLHGSIGGISIWQEIMDNISIGSGISYHYYKSGINPDDRRHHQPAIQSYRAILIPLRVSYRIQQSEFPFSLTPRLGYQFGIVLDNPVLQSASSLISDMDGTTMTYSLTENPAPSNTLHLIEAGFTAEYRFSNNWQLAASFSHFSGLGDVKSALVDYTTSAGDTRQASYTNDGGRIQTTLNLGIPLSNLWENRDVRLHRKIENSFGRGGSTRKYRYIYLGGDLGALWRSFSSSNPAVGPRPVSGKGIFRYSNLHTGAYVGYTFNGITGVDIGAYYQRSSTFYSIMYDHEVDFVTEVRAPMFLEFPVMFRYFYDLFDHKVFLMPSIGISVLTHFAGQNYNSGNGAFEYASLAGPASATSSFSSSRIARFGYTVRAGLGVEYDLPIKFPLAATFNLLYSHGLRNIDQIEVTNTVSETPAINTINYDGSGWTASLGVRVPILLGKDNRKCGAMPRIR